MCNLVYLNMVSSIQLFWIKLGVADISICSILLLSSECKNLCYTTSFPLLWYACNTMMNLQKGQGFFLVLLVPNAAFATLTHCTLPLCHSSRCHWSLSQTEFLINLGQIFTILTFFQQKTVNLPNTFGDLFELIGVS